LRTSAALAAVVIVLAACGPAASGDASEDESTQESAAAASEPLSSDGGPQPSFSAGLVADLEALIPDEIAGMTMQIESMQGNEFLLEGDPDPATAKFLEDLGVSPSDVSMAFGFGFSSDFASSAGMFVFRAEGADSARLLSAFKEATEAESDEPITWTSTTLAGKSVESSTQADATNYLYVKDDVLIWFFASSLEIAEEIARGLP
jgi:hypothetical protein